MTCLSPRVSNQTQDELVVDVKFKMDGVDLNRSSFQLHYVQRPAVFPDNTTCASVTGNLFTYLLHIQVRITTSGIIRRFLNIYIFFAHSSSACMDDL